MGWIGTGLTSFGLLTREFVYSLVGLSSVDAHKDSEFTCFLYDGSHQTQFCLEIFPSEDQDECAGTDWIVLFLQTCLYLAITWASRVLLCQPFAKTFLITDQAHATNRRISKFGAAASDLLLALFSSIFAFLVISPLPWWPNRSEWAVLQTTFTPTLKYFYLLYAARTASDFLSSFFQIQRSDASVYFVHQLVTFFLVIGSAQTGYVRVGCVILLFVDWPEIFLRSAKLFKYSSLHPNDGFHFVADRLFEIFGVTFIVTRNIAFSYVAFCIIVDIPSLPITLLLMKALILLLVALMTFWMILILQIARSEYAGNGLDDLRSDDDDEIADKKYQ